MKELNFKDQLRKTFDDLGKLSFSLYEDTQKVHEYFCETYSKVAALQGQVGAMISNHVDEKEATKETCSSEKLSKVLKEVGYKFYTDPNIPLPEPLGDVFKSMVSEEREKHIRLFYHIFNKKNYTLPFTALNVLLASYIPAGELRNKLKFEFSADVDPYIASIERLIAKAIFFNRVDEPVCGISFLNRSNGRVYLRYKNEESHLAPLFNKDLSWVINAGYYVVYSRPCEIVHHFKNLCFNASFLLPTSQQDMADFYYGYFTIRWDNVGEELENEIN